jgi:hypothetical protein
MNPVALAFLTIASFTPAARAEACLGPDQARIHAGVHDFIVLPDAIKAARRVIAGETISANLCRVDGRLMYVLAILAKDGRVVRAIVDPENAAVRQLP